jgi:hypothetical protein
LSLALIAGFWGCSTSVSEGTAQQPAASLQSLEYYSQLVKGYQNSYPPRRVLVLASVDAREFTDPTAAVHAPDQGNPAIGVVLDADGSVTQRLYSLPFLTDVGSRSSATAATVVMDQAGGRPPSSRSTRRSTSRRFVWRTGRDTVPRNSAIRP